MARHMVKCPVLFFNTRLDATGAAIRTFYLLISEKPEKGQVSYFWLNTKASTNKQDENTNLRIRQEGHCASSSVGKLTCCI